MLRPALLALPLLALALPALAQPSTYPSAEMVAELLKKEPLSETTWPAWRRRLSDWFGDKSRSTDAAYRAAEKFVRAQQTADGALPPALAKDHLAWYFLGGSYLRDP